MSDVTDGFTWAALVAALVGMLLAVRRRAPRGDSRAGRLAALLFGLVVLLNTVPRLAGAPSDLTLALSSIALLPLAGFIALITRAGQAGRAGRPGQQ